MTGPVSGDDTVNPINIGDVWQGAVWLQIYNGKDQLQAQLQQHIHD